MAILVYMEAPFPPDNAETLGDKQASLDQMQAPGLSSRSRTHRSSTGHLPSVRQGPQDKPGNYTTAAGWEMWTKAAVEGKAFVSPYVTSDRSSVPQLSSNTVP